MKKRIIFLVMLIVALSIAFVNAGELDNNISTISVENIKPVLEKVASYNYQKIKLTWEKIEEIDGYEIYRSSSKDGKFKKIATVKTPEKVTYINGSRTTGKTYYYKLRAYKKIDEKTVYTKYSDILSAKARPNKAKIKEVYGCENRYGEIHLEWNEVKGADGYQFQVKWFKDGKWSEWKNNPIDADGKNQPFKDYNWMVESNKKAFGKRGTRTYIETINGETVFVERTPEEAAMHNVGKTRAFVDMEEDESIYQFRMRAYKKVYGKKVYGLWSDPYELTENINMEEIKEELKNHTIKFVKERNIDFIYDFDTEGRNPENSSYYVSGVLGKFSRYAKQEKVIEWYKYRVENYIERNDNADGQESGFIYIRRVLPGDDEGVTANFTDQIYYKVWMLY